MTFSQIIFFSEEISIVRDVLSSLTSNSLAAFVTNVLPVCETSNKMDSMSGKDEFNGKEVKKN